jgi:Ca2+-binding RTX toxin-like protein
MSNLKQNSLSLQAYQNTSYDSLSLTFNEKKIKQMVLVASSSYNETAGDLDEGGLFSVTLWKNIDQLINQKRNIKMNDFFTNIAKQVQASNPSQTPQFAFFPASVAEELLFFEKNQKNEEEDIVQGKQEDILQGNEKEDILQGNEEEDILQGNEKEDILQGNEKEDILQGNEKEDLQNHSSLNQDSQNSSIHEEEGPYLKVIEPTVLKKGTMAQSIIISSNLKCSLPKGSVIYYENISSKINGHYMLKLKDSPKGCEHLGLTSIYIFSNHVEK